MAQSIFLVFFRIVASGDGAMSGNVFDDCKIDLLVCCTW
jgi:hypothetical protein